MKTVKIGGKDRPVHFGVNGLAEFNHATGTDFEWIFTLAANPMKMDFFQVRWLVYIGLREGSIENGEKVDFSIQDVGNWLDKEFHRFNDIVHIMVESLPSMEEDEKNP